MNRNGIAYISLMATVFGTPKAWAFLRAFFRRTTSSWMPPNLVLRLVMLRRTADGLVIFTPRSGNCEFHENGRREARSSRCSPRGQPEPMKFLDFFIHAVCPILVFHTNEYLCLGVPMLAVRRKVLAVLAHQRAPPTMTSAPSSNTPSRSLLLASSIIRNCQAS